MYPFLSWCARSEGRSALFKGIVELDKKSPNFGRKILAGGGYGDKVLDYNESGDVIVKSLASIDWEHIDFSNVPGGFYNEYIVDLGDAEDTKKVLSQRGGILEFPSKNNAKALLQLKEVFGHRNRELRYWFTDKLNRAFLEYHRFGAWEASIFGKKNAAKELAEKSYSAADVEAEIEWARKNDLISEAERQRERLEELGVGIKIGDKTFWIPFTNFGFPWFRKQFSAIGGWGGLADLFGNWVLRMGKYLGTGK